MSTRIEAAHGADTMIRALGLDRSESWETFAAGERVNESSRGFVRRFHWPEGSPDVYYFKLYRQRTPWKPWKALWSAFERDPARREQDNLEWLRTRGFAAVAPVAWGCRRAVRIVRECFLVTRGETSLERLDSVLAAAAKNRRDPARLREALRAVARLVRRVHDAGFFAHDLHCRNVLCARDAVLGPGTQQPSFTLLDFPNGFVLPPSDPRRRAAAIYDLAVLDRGAAAFLSRTDRLRFLRAYLDSDTIDRELITLIDRRRRRQIEKHGLRIPRAVS
jgi:Lipopolysaccharide kinase (Kdo/WaaP) family